MDEKLLITYGFPALGGLLALLFLFLALRAGRHQRLVSDLPTSKTTGVFIGLVELKGTAEAEQPLISYLAEQSCVYYQWQVDEQWSRVVTETYTDSEGRTQTRTRIESGSTTVAQGGDQIPFYLQDDCGIIRIQPEKAKVEPRTTFDYSCGPSASLYYAKGPAAPSPIPLTAADSSSVRFPCTSRFMWSVRLVNVTTWSHPKSPTLHTLKSF